MKCGNQWKEATVLQITDRTKLPSFKQVSPWVYYSCWSFAMLNLLFLAPAFFFGESSAGLSLVQYIPSVMWGVVFVSFGVAMIYGLLVNNWKVIKLFLALGLIVKALFAWALVFTLFSNFANIGVIGVWFGLMVWQSLCIVYFTPEMHHVRLQ